MVSTKLYCPGCGNFRVRVERVIGIQLGCYDCRRDLEFVRAPIGLAIQGTEHRMQDRVTIILPGKVSGKPRCPTCGKPVHPDRSGEAVCDRCSRDLVVIYTSQEVRTIEGGRQLRASIVVWFPEPVGGD